MTQAENTNNTQVEVVVKAIDGDSLVLETIPKGKSILWPILNIPRPLDIGNRLTLELRQNETGVPVVALSSNTEDDNNEKKRRLLEELVN